MWRNKFMLFCFSSHIIGPWNLRNIKDGKERWKVQLMMAKHNPSWSYPYLSSEYWCTTKCPFSYYTTLFWYKIHQSCGPRYMNGSQLLITQAALWNEAAQCLGLSLDQSSASQVASKRAMPLHMMNTVLHIVVCKNCCPLLTIYLTSVLMFI